MTRGCTARVALPAATLTDFIEAKTEYRDFGHPRRNRRFINGFPMLSTTDSRTIRRWRATGGTVTKHSASRLLEHYYLDLGQFSYWCEVRKTPSTIRGTL